MSLKANFCLGYLLVIILRDVAEEFTSLPEQNILLTEFFL